MKTWWVIKHVAGEGPGLLAEELDRRHLQHRTVEFSQAHTLPAIEDVAGAIVLGGPMNVDETGRFPFLAAEREWLATLLDTSTPVLGICLGSQMMARARGAVVRPNGKKEIGYYPIRLTGEGRRDPLFAGLPDEFETFHWHGDRFEIPSGSANLATSEICDRQAFRVGERAYALQFHPEITATMIRSWVAKGEEELREVGISSASLLNNDVRLAASQIHSRRIMGNFFGGEKIS